MQVADLERLLSQSRLATYYQFFSYDGKYTKNLFLNQPSRQKKSRSYDRLQLKIKSMKSTLHFVKYILQRMFNVVLHFGLQFQPSGLQDTIEPFNDGLVQLIILDHDVVAINVVDQVDHPVVDHHKNLLGVVLNEPFVRNGGVGQSGIIHPDQRQTNVGTKNLLVCGWWGWIKPVFQVQINFKQ